MVEFQSRFDENTAKSLNKRSFKKYWRLFVLISVLFVFAGVVNAIFPEDAWQQTYGICFIAVGVLFYPLVILLTNIFQKKINKTMPLMSSETKETYQFFEDRVIIIQRKGEEYEGTTNARYSYLYSVEETRDSYFLLISKMQAHVVNKADLTQGSVEELNQILSLNLGDKFKPMK